MTGHEETISSVRTYLFAPLSLKLSVNRFTSYRKEGNYFLRLLTKHKEAVRLKWRWLN